jgi:hypothetical protein
MIGYIQEGHGALVSKDVVGGIADSTVFSSGSDMFRYQVALDTLPGVAAVEAAQDSPINKAVLAAVAIGIGVIGVALKKGGK